LTKSITSPGGNEVLTLAVDTNTIATKTYVDNTIADAGSVLQNSDYLAGEAMTQGDSMFVEQ
jgi:hypothetical protein